jgi:hypothetical protein
LFAGILILDEVFGMKTTLLMVALLLLASLSGYQAARSSTPATTAVLEVTRAPGASFRSLFLESPAAANEDRPLKGELKTLGPSFEFPLQRAGFICPVDPLKEIEPS